MLHTPLNWLIAWCVYSVAGVLKSVSCDAWGLLIIHIFHIMVSYYCDSSHHTLQANKDFWKECGGAIKYVYTLVRCFVFHLIKSNS